MDEQKKMNFILLFFSHSLRRVAGPVFFSENHYIDAQFLGFILTAIMSKLLVDISVICLRKV